MWIIETAYSDTPERIAGRPAHRARLAELHEEGKVRMAGPFAGGTGALIIAEAPDRKALDQVLADDPYLMVKGVSIVSIREWNPILI
jgi:uncharacterized protein YciI